MASDARPPLTTRDTLALFARHGKRPTGLALNLTLVRELAGTSFRLRYADSMLGYLWSLIRPALMFGLLYVVFALWLFRGRTSITENFPIQLLVGIAAWTFFAEATSTAVSSVAANSDVLKKVRFARWVLVIAAVLSASITLFVNFMLVFVLGLALHWYNLGLRSLLVIPLLIEFTGLALGIGMFLAALFVRYRDLGYVWEFLLLLLFYASGIIFPLSLIPAQYHWAVMLNPVAQIIQDLRHALVSPSIPWSVELLGGLAFVPFVGVLLWIALGSLVFARTAPRFTDHL